MEGTLPMWRLTRESVLTVGNSTRISPPTWSPVHWATSPYPALTAGRENMSGYISYQTDWLVTRGRGLIGWLLFYDLSHGILWMNEIAFDWFVLTRSTLLTLSIIILTWYFPLSYSTTCKGTLDRHIRRIHSQENIRTCPYCGKRSKDLRRHFQNTQVCFTEIFTMKYLHWNI